MGFFGFSKYNGSTGTADGCAYLVLAIGAALAISVYRFAWDLGTQTIIHVILLPAFLIFSLHFRPTLTPLYHASLALFFLVALTSIAGAVEKSAVRDALMVFADSLVASYLVSCLTWQQKKHLLLIPVFAAAWLSAMLIAYFIQAPTGYYLPHEIVINPSVIAGYLTIALPLSFVFIHDKGKYYYVLPATIFLGIVLTKSRAAVFISGATILFWLMRQKPQYLRQRFIVPLAVLLLGFLLMMLTQMKQGNSLHERLLWARTAFEMFSHHPFLGIGWGNFGNLYLAYRSALGANTLYAHNILLQTLAEIGFPGLVLFAAAILLVVREYAITRVTAPGYIALPLLLSVLSFLTLNLIDYGYFVPGLMFLFWVIAGSLFSVGSESRPQPLVHPLATGALILAAITVAALPFFGNYFYLRSRGIHREDPAQALGSLRRSIRFDALPSAPYAALAEAHFRLYKTNHDRREFEESINAQLRAIDRYPACARYWSDLAWLNWTDNRRDRAIAAMQSAVRYDPHNLRYHRALNDFQVPVTPPAGTLDAALQKR